MKLKQELIIVVYLHNYTTEFPQKSRSLITFYVFVIKLWWKELQSQPKNVLLNGLEVRNVKYNDLEKLFLVLITFSLKINNGTVCSKWTVGR